MTIDFSCPRCGTRFRVNERLAGKKGRCNKCERRFRIPAASPAAPPVAMSGMFRLGHSKMFGSLAAASMGAGASVKQGGLVMPTDVALAPISDPELRQARLVDPDLLEDDIPGPYKLAELPPSVRRVKKKAKPAGAVKMFYRGQMNTVLRWLRKISDFAYLISIPFITLVLIGIILKDRNWAVIGATGVVVLGVGRFAVDGFSLAVLPFKSGPLQGVLFLLPPLTFFYLAKHWKRMKRGTLRLLGGVIPIAGVVLVFTFVPWLTKGTPRRNASIGEKIRAEVEVLEEDIGDELSKAGAAIKDELEDRGVPVDRTLGNIKRKASELKKSVEKKNDKDSADPQ